MLNVSCIILHGFAWHSVVHPLNAQISNFGGAYTSGYIILSKCSKYHIANNYMYLEDDTKIWYDFADHLLYDLMLCNGTCLG